MSKKRNRRRYDVDVIQGDNVAQDQSQIHRTKTHFHLKDIESVSPITNTQKDLFAAYNSNYNVFTYGSAGTGKTFLTLFLALRDVLDERTPYDKVMILRSAEPTKNVGFLPGDLDEKLEVFEKPYICICDQLFEYNNSYANLKKGGYVSFDSTSYIRGMTFDHSIILVDESQNLTLHELSSIITRVGKNSKIMFMGDLSQSDLTKSRHEKSGLADFMRIIERMHDDFAIIQFMPKDIVRSGLVKSFILAKEELEL